MLSSIWYPLFVITGIVAAGFGAPIMWGAFQQYVLGDDPTGARKRETLATTIAGVLLLGAVAPGSCYMTMLPSLHAEYWLPSVAGNGDQLVEAIERFCAARGAPPAALQDLVPGYLQILPDTGYPRSTQWEYRSDGTSWSLYVPIDSFLDWDEFQYSPKLTPDAGFRRIIRNGKWLYLDD